MEVPFKIGRKEFLIKPYKTWQEKDVLLASSFGVTDLTKILDILHFKTDEVLTEEEKKVLLYKHREISLGDEVDIKFKCDKCGQGNDGIIEASNFVVEPKRFDDDIKQLELTVTKENMFKFVTFDPDELDIDEYENLINRIKENQTHFDFIKSVPCLKCGTKKQFDMSSPEYIIEIMSEDNLMTLYKAYNYLIFFGKYSKEGIDSMYPFERSIFVGLLNKTKQDLSK